MQDVSGDKLRGHLDVLVLSTLERDPAHGMEIVRRIEGAARGLLRLKEGTLYPALYRLENAGLIEAEWEAETPGRRGARRRIYQLTRKGRAALARGKSDWRQFTTVIDGILGTGVST
jgi:transcriptional regulator